MTDDLIAFIRARLDEVERDAGKARPMAGHSLKWQALRTDRPHVRASRRTEEDDQVS